MSEHKWLTDQEVRLIELDASGRYGDGIDPRDVLCLIADWREMRKLWVRKTEPTMLDHPLRILKDVKAMLNATK